MSAERRPTYVSHSPSFVVVLVTSFGYLHGGVRRADVLVDVREHLRDPHVDPAFRELTGHDTAVMERVLATPGAGALIDALWSPPLPRCFPAPARPGAWCGWRSVARAAGTVRW